MNKVSFDVLYEEYVNKKKPMWLIAKQQNVAVGTIYNYLHKYNIEVRPKMSQLTKDKISKSNKGKPSKFKGIHLSIEQRKKISESKKGKYRIKTLYGGHRKKREDGYIQIYLPTHPNNNCGYVLEHRLIMEKFIGRYLNDDEVVHHINHVRNDNRIENLMLLSFKEHARLHMQERQKRRRSLSIG